ncbi:MAG: hypothetical protein COB35_05435 [Gammaproteobacteria bacterium]|nr:MAG: hypothetical protein COB35_05435 [Gammaproteobacteria bacterium]
MLICCQANAYPNVTKPNLVQIFTKTIADVKKLKDSDTGKALQLLNSAKENLDKLSLVNQLTFYKYQADIYADLSRFQLAKDVATFGLDLAKKLKKPNVLISELSYIRGFAIESLGNFKLASEDYLNGLDVAQSLNDQQFIAQGLINMGAIYYQTNRYKLSLMVLNDALKIANNLKDEDLQGYINTELGSLYSYLGELDQSLKFYRTAYQHYSNIGKDSYALNSLANMAANYQSNRHYGQAIDVYKEIIDKLKGKDDNAMYYNVYMGLSWSFLRQKKSDPETAYQYLLIAEQYLGDVERHSAKLSFLIDKSYVLEGLQRFDDALDSLAQAENLFTIKQKQENNFNYISILGLKAKISRSLGHYETAYKTLSEYVERYITYLKAEQISAVQEVRLRYESEQSELQKKSLKKEGSDQALELLQAETKNRNQQLYFMVIALAVLIFAWLLYKLVKGQRRLLITSRTDVLTGLVNRRRLLQVGKSLCVNAQKQQTELSLLMIDLDFFKKVNDDFGHKQGDIVLQTLAQLGNEMFRKNDVFARFGGEEFVVLLPNTSKEQAINVADRLCKKMAAQTWQHNSKSIPSITLSIGVATNKKFTGTSTDSLDFEQLIKQADDLLYQAKALGRNKVCA